jgi:D-lyxose ketol-isomerase
VREPVADEEGAVLGEVAIVEDEEELAALLQPLDRVQGSRMSRVAC